MKNLYTRIAISTFIFVFSGCETYYTVYDISLSEVLTPTRVKDSYGEQKIYHIDSMGIKHYYFENKMVRILWSPSAYGIGFTIENEADFPIKVLWDDAAFVDEMGRSHHVIHSGVQFIYKRDPQTPAVIPRKGRISDLVYPIEYILGDVDGGWDEAPIFPYSSSSLGMLKTQSRHLFGKSFQVFLPLSIQDVVNEYTFTFLINDVNYK